MVTIRPVDPAVQGMFTFELHDQVFDALVEQGAIRDAHLDPDRLEQWADACDNPDGQRATLVRALAQLRRLTPLELR